MGKLMSFNGRVNRSTYFLAWLATTGPALLMYLNIYRGSMDGTVTGGGATFQLLLMLVLAVIGLSFQVRRWHDIGKSGWWSLISLVPLIGGLYALVMNFFVAGDPGPNQYGSAPGSVAPGYARP